jgi:hypothetical protein
VQSDGLKLLTYEFIISVSDERRQQLVLRLLHVLCNV